MRASYPEALEIIPAEEDPGTAFYRRLFADMDAPRAAITLSPEEVHGAVMAGLIAPAATRGSVVLAFRDPARRCALMAIPREQWEPFTALAILDPDSSTVH